MTNSFNKAPTPGQRDPEELQAELVTAMVTLAYGEKLNADETVEGEGKAERLLKKEMEKDPDLLVRFDSGSKDLVVYEMSEKLKEWEKNKKSFDEDEEEESGSKFHEVKM